MDEASVLPVEVTSSLPPPRRSRSRVVSGVVAAMLVAGAGGIGFGLGRAAAPADDSVADAPQATPTTEAAVVPSSPAPTPPISDASELTELTDEAVAAPTTVAEFVSPPPAAGGLEYELVWDETTAEDVRVRVLVGPASQEMAPGDYGVPGWMPAPFCWGTREVRLTVDGPDVVDVTYGQWFDEVYDGVAMPLIGDIGMVDGHPLRLLVVQVDGAVDEVVVQWDDGVAARSEVVDGLAVLLSDGSGSWGQGFELELVGQAGSRTLTQADLDRSGDPVWREACTPPPPELPAAGDQPADPDAERAAITERFAILWDQDTPPEDKPDVLDDRTGVDDAVTAVSEGGFGATAQTAVHEIDEIVFTTPSTAWFRYGIDTDNGYFGDRYGVAKLTGDGWIFPRALICQDLALAGGQCEPAPETIYPPAWYELNGQQCTYSPDDPEGRCFGYDESEIAAWL